MFDIEESAECSEDYLHVGNNMNFKNMKSLTSYKFCGREPPLEIVSRRNEMWIIFKTNSTGFHAGFLLHYQVLPQGKYRNFLNCYLLLFSLCLEANFEFIESLKESPNLDLF